MEKLPIAAKKRRPGKCLCVSWDIPKKRGFSYWNLTKFNTPSVRLKTRNQKTNTQRLSLLDSPLSSVLWPQQRSVPLLTLPPHLTSQTARGLLPPARIINLWRLESLWLMMISAEGTEGWGGHWIRGWKGGQVLAFWPPMRCHKATL